MLTFPKIQVVISSNGRSCTQILEKWLRAFNLDWRYGSTENFTELARNQNINRFLQQDVPRGKEYFLGIDQDMVPLIETRGILLDPGELIYCGHCGRHGSPGHYGDGELSCACFRIHHSVLEAIAKPYFKILVEDDVRTQCECLYFRDKALALGHKSRMVGVIGHEQQCILIPAPTASKGWALAWPEDLGG